MTLPECPNHKRSKVLCERSAIRLMGENDDSFQLTCATCNLFWAITKPKTKERGRYEAQMRRIQQASEVERDKARRRSYSFAR